ncbi:MAG: leucyl aminopeptidase [Frankiales bacterium]|nr:leucyl aminopeptidase [Frankiales bacterium]
MASDDLRPAVVVVDGSADAAPPTADVVAVRVSPGADGAVPGPDALALGQQLGVDIPAYLQREKARGEAGEITAMPVLPAAPKGPKTVLLVGVGDASARSLRKAGAAVVRRARDARTVATTVAVDADALAFRAFVEAVLLASYSYSLKTSSKPSPLRKVTVVYAGDADAVDRATATARAVRLARDLINTPSMEKTPAWLAERAVRYGERAGLDVVVRDEQALAAEGFGGILGVGGGSSRPPRFIEMSYRPRGARGHVVLVGKGITFDSGGLSLKTSDGMVTMKTDMAGGAAVIATMTALGELGVKTRVTGLIPAAENMPSGSATRPGDVLTHYGGRTVEVLNTDAEGRLVLADGLAYAAKNLRPDVMVDLATLTGAASLGLGRVHGALFSTDESLADHLLTAAETAGEQLWRMPLVEDYRDALDSDIADLQNIGNPHKHYSGGAISAALFLREFTGGMPWAHLDIAGPARSDKDEGEITKGGTGYGVRLLLRWLEQAAPV